MRMSLTLLLGAMIISNQANADTYLEELKALSLVESSGGINTEHALIERGMHAGTRAGGHYGIMPIVAREVIEKSKALTKKYGYVLDLSNDEITEELNTNRKLDRELALYMWAKLRATRSIGEAACAWYRGPYAKSCKIQEQRANCEYVAKYKTYLKLVSNEYAPNR
jgi:hypothetical protein